jgi:hypothetical protein
VTKQQLRTFLQNDAGKVGKQLDNYFDPPPPPPHKPPPDRSTAAGQLMQTLMLHAHRLPGCANAPFTVRCANVMAYWMASDVYGKAGEKGYSPEKDAASLIAQIVNGDPYGAQEDGRRWVTPFWAKSHATAAPASAPAPTAPMRAHRPAGDRDKHLATFRRVLEAIEPDAFGRRTYTLEYLADKMKAARCAAAPRTIQSYLKTLRDTEEIVTAQIGGNGMPYAVLTRCFGGADNYQNHVKTNTKPDEIGGAVQRTDERMLTPKDAESTHNAKEDHQNPSAPAALPAGWVRRVPGFDDSAEPEAGCYDPAHVTLASWRDPRTMRVPPEPIDRTAPPRHSRRQRRQKGQESFLGRDGIAAKIARRKRHGEAPAPTPYRPRAALVTEDLPEPPPAAAPAGAHSAGAPLPAPAGALTPAQRMAARRARAR